MTGSVGFLNGDGINMTASGNNITVNNTGVRSLGVTGGTSITGDVKLFADPTTHITVTPAQNRINFGLSNPMKFQTANALGVNTGTNGFASPVYSFNKVTLSRQEGVDTPIMAHFPGECRATVMSVGKGNFADSSGFDAQVTIENGIYDGLYIAVLDVENKTVYAYAAGDEVFRDTSDLSIPFAYIWISRELMPESEYKELHRAEIVDKIFTNLEKRSDSGIGQFRCMLKELTEWNYFDPYYFQKLNKLSESEAKRNISHLKQLQEIRDYKIKQERQRQEEQERKRKDISISINELKEIFLNLFSGKDQNGKEINVQRRGYLFEEFLKKLFLNEGIEVTEPFKIVGEQIDGSIKYDGEHYIIEAKWHDKWSASDSLYQFAAKVEGKMYGRGVFISVNGFSPDSVQALTTGKALRTILVDGGDLVPITEGMYTLREMLDNKIKAAQTMGRIYVIYTCLK